jgi:hypothetical protein
MQIVAGELDKATLLTSRLADLANAITASLFHRVSDFCV